MAPDKKRPDGGFLSDEVEKIENKEQDESKGFLEDEVKRIESATEGFENVQHKPDIHFKSSEDMSELSNESVELAVTSPPYNAGWDYGSVDDNQNYATEYLPMLARVFKEVYRVLRPGGRFCVNVPSLLRSGAEGGYPIGADITRMMVADDLWTQFKLGMDSPVVDVDQDNLQAITDLQASTDWVIREQIAWVKTFNHDGLAPNGSFPRPWGVLLNNLHEVVLVFQKPGDREYDDMSSDTIEDSKINKKQDDLCDDVWHISPESWTFEYIDGEDVPVFPEELPKRCIRLWTYKDDKVLDPFAGRGTTLKVAKELDRHSVGYEIREDLRRDIMEYTGMNQTGLESW